jgi:hypothetical protein
VFAIFVRLFQEQKAYGKATGNYCGANKVRKKVGKCFENSALENRRDGQCGACENTAKRRANDGTTKERSVLRPNPIREGGRGEGTRTQDTRQTALLNTRALCCRVSAVVFDRPSNKLTLVLLHRYHFSDRSL